MRCGFKEIGFNSTVAEPSGFNSRCKRAMIRQPSTTFILSLVAIGRGIVSLMILSFL